MENLSKIKFVPPLPDEMEAAWLKLKQEVEQLLKDVDPPSEES